MMSIVKTIDVGNQRFISEIYKKLAKKESELLSLDLEFSTERDVKYILDSFKFWKDIKQDLFKLSELINSNWDKKLGLDKRGYFG
jgi:hypothetical protein